MKFNLKVYCEKRRLKDIRSFVEDKLKNFTTDEVEINQLVLAVDEVCANLMIHSNNCNPTESIDIDVKLQSDGVVFEIFDKGKQFNIKNYREPSIQEVVHSKRKGGLGLILVKKIMDKVEFTNEKKGNVCRMYKHFTANP